jgi:hypothetical protein
MSPAAAERTLVLFNHDFDEIAHRELAARWPLVGGGFDLFAFPSQVRLAWFDIERFAALQSLRAKALGCKAVLSHHEQFGALAAALVAERMGWPGTPVRAVLACQHKLYARQVLQKVCPEANVPSVRLNAAPRSRWGVAPRDEVSLHTINGVASASSSSPALCYPLFAKPIKAAFSVLAREIRNDTQLRGLVGFGLWESALIKLLVQPFERVVQSRLPEAGTAMGMMLEQPVHAEQFNLDGYVFEGRVQPLGVVDAVMYPGTQAFMRFDYPTRLKPAVVQRAVDISRRFLQAVGFTHGLFNMEFFYDEASDALSVIEFNPRAASQFSDLYQRVEGLNLHEVGLALAHGLDPAALPKQAATARVASSFVYRSFPGRRAGQVPTRSQRELLHAAYPDALLLDYPRAQAAVERDHKWLGSCRHGILHLGGEDALDLQRRCEVASHLLGWTPPYAQYHGTRGDMAGAPSGPDSGASEHKGLAQGSLSS